MTNRRQFLTGCATVALAIGCLPLTALAAREAVKKIYPVLYVPDLAPTPLPPGTYNMRIVAVKLAEQTTGQKAPFESITMRMETLND